MKRYLSALQVAELAELLEDAPARVGVVDEVLQAAAEGRGMTLKLTDATRSSRVVRSHGGQGRIKPGIGTADD